MKKLAILLTLTMLVSSVAVFAAPQIDYMFYSEEDSTYYAFGSYINYADYNETVDDENNNDNISEVGVYLNGQKYQLKDDKFQTSYNKNSNNLFGIGFEASADYFENGFAVTPYYQYPLVGIIKGDKEVMSASSVAPSPSSDATLETVNIYYYKTMRDLTGVTISPKFSPETTEYTVYTAQNAGASATTGYVIDCKPSYSKAIVSTPTEGKTSTVTVTAEDGTSKTYTFNFSFLGSTNKGYTCAKSATYKNDNGTTTIEEETTAYNQLVKYPATTRSYYNPIITFKLSDYATQLNKAKRVSLSFRLASYTNNVSTAVKDVTIGAYDVTDGVNVADDGTISYTAANITKGAKAGEQKLLKFYTVGSSGWVGAYSIDITDYIKGLLASDTQPEYCTLMLSIDSFDYTDSLTKAITYRMSTSTSNANHAPCLTLSY